MQRWEILLDPQFLCLSTCLGIKINTIFLILLSRLRLILLIEFMKMSPVEPFPYFFGVGKTSMNFPSALSDIYVSVLHLRNVGSTYLQACILLIQSELPRSYVPNLACALEFITMEMEISNLILLFLYQRYLLGEGGYLEITKNFWVSPCK